MPTSRLSWLVLSAFLLPVLGQAGDGIVRWQDAKGNWHFSNHATVDPNQRPAVAEKPKTRADAALLDPGAQVTQSPEALQAWLVALKKQVLLLRGDEAAAYLAKVHWPSTPVSWNLLVQEVINKDFLNPDRGDFQLRARTVGLKNIPVAFDTRQLPGARGLQRDSLIKIHATLILTPAVLDTMDQYGYLYKPLPLEVSDYQLIRK